MTIYETEKIRFVQYLSNELFKFNPLTANDELSRHENLTFLWTWILRWVPRSFATNASLCNALSSNKLCPKTVKILAVKGLINGTPKFKLDLPLSNKV